MWETIIGLEVHTQLRTKSKIFSSASTDFGSEQNTQACAIDLGLPGVLPVLNKDVVFMAIKFGLAINGKIAKKSIFARKNYFYPDLPKGYQISQYELPIVESGSINIFHKDKSKKIGITRAHLEEDAGKSVHDLFDDKSAIDLNRAGTPLIEIVSEPDIRSAEEAVIYLKKLHSLVRYLEISDGNMEQGSFRCDANVSVKKNTDKKLGIRAEIKNINSFKFVENAINFEVNRQINLLENGNSVIQETRLYDPIKNETRPMRSKEEANDYRYFPDPDLLPVVIDSSMIEKIKSDMPELPDKRLERFIKSYKLSEYDANILIADKFLANYFEETLKANNLESKIVANWIITEILALAKKSNIDTENFPVEPNNLNELLVFVKDDIISSKQAKEILQRMWLKGEKANTIIEKEGFQQISDSTELDKIVENVLKNNYKSVEEYMSGKTKLFGFFVGQVMKETEGKANPKIVNELLRGKLDKKC
ncbi:MAG: Asp-tRNA(Asn)/Glu-tRNA(Gln) amidotransferase GatCAB subunit B [Gammaproteobacteria bacterium]|nr:Asp-tRNA(Asn)/Glu-tRNA(Gln) amidotransferase GatCAB subunit B [Gammaproteobacteria bacterium]|tara:strand:- start:164441 stop:165877 length:1437 start_codon:yes stop_codon:yes gene_type:complete